MIEKEFVPYELALEFKQLGFDDEVIATYPKNRRELKLNNVKVTETTKAILFQQAFRWFRKEYALESYIRANLCVDVPKTYQFNIDDNIDDVWYDTYEEAELACLKKLIEIVKGGNK